MILAKSFDPVRELQYQPKLSWKCSQERVCLLWNFKSKWRWNLIHVGISLLSCCLNGILLQIEKHIWIVFALPGSKVNPQRKEICSWAFEFENVHNIELFVPWPTSYFLDHTLLLVVPIIISLKVYNLRLCTIIEWDTGATRQQTVSFVLPF